MLQKASLPNRVKEFYERVTVERGAALVQLPDLYDETIHFLNPVVDGHGLAAFREAWDTALRKYKVFEFHDMRVVGSDEEFSLVCSMTISFGLGPTFTTEMVAWCRGRGGKVVYLRDYFDPLGALVEPIAPARWCYRKAFGLLVA